MFIIPFVEFYKYLQRSVYMNWLLYEQQMLKFLIIS